MANAESQWPSVVVAIAFVDAVTAIFLVVYSRDGIDAAIKAWGAIGTLVGVVVGAIPSYFFRQAAKQAQADVSKLMAAADEGTLARAHSRPQTLILSLKLLRTGTVGVPAASLIGRA